MNESDLGLRIKAELDAKGRKGHSRSPGASSKKKSPLGGALLPQQALLTPQQQLAYYNRNG